MQGSTDVRWYVADGLGSVVGEMDVNGNVTSGTTRDVYGLTRASYGTATSRQGFVGQSCGHITDPETGGLVYMRARYYDPQVGRFASEDSAKDGLNWYGYCNANPVCFTDASGKSAELVSWLNCLSGLTIGSIAWYATIEKIILSGPGAKYSSDILMKMAAALDAMAEAYLSDARAILSLYYGSGPGIFDRSDEMKFKAASGNLIRQSAVCKIAAAQLKVWAMALQCFDWLE